MNFAIYTPDTGTHELPAVHVGRPLAEALTTPLSGIPSHPTRYRASATARAVIHARRVARRIARSQAARDLKDWAAVMALFAFVVLCLAGGDWLHLAATGGLR